VRQAGFSRTKRLEDFDFDANPNVPAALIHTLAEGAWITAGQPLCLIGDSGTGKSHLLIGLEPPPPPNTATACATPLQPPS
jgi:DNA replication protein DnaC